MFSLMCAWTNGWASNREAGDLRRHRAHYDATLMLLMFRYVSHLTEGPNWTPTAHAAWCHVSFHKPLCLCQSWLLLAVWTLRGWNVDVLAVAETWKNYDDVIKWKHFRLTGPSCGEFTVYRWIPLVRPVTQSFDVLFDLHLNKRFSTQSRRRWFETPLRSLWRHCNV